MARHQRTWRSAPATKPYLGVQLRLPLPRQHKSLTIDPKAKRARDQRETTRYEQILEALRKHPRMARAWNSTFTGVGYFIPRSQADEPNPFRRFIKSGMAGLSDFSGFTKFGRPVFIEVKVEDGTLADVQQNFLEVVEAVGGIGAIAHTPSEVWDILEAMTSYEATRAWHNRIGERLDKWEQQLHARRNTTRSPSGTTCQNGRT